ncbi:uncharacterized protein TNCV_3221911 [Trichonephila clavipes]|nr:uncharacterized protein TNCV_3221911 [Trichonephila clavipes]
MASQFGENSLRNSCLAFIQLSSNFLQRFRSLVGISSAYYARGCFICVRLTPLVSQPACLPCAASRKEENGILGILCVPFGPRLPRMEDIGGLGIPLRSLWPTLSPYGGDWWPGNTSAFPLAHASLQTGGRSEPAPVNRLVVPLFDVPEETLISERNSWRTKSVKRLRFGDLLVETSSAIQTKSLLLTKTFLDSPVNINPHKTLNTSRGVISEPHLLYTSEAEILEGFSDQGVIQTKKFGNLCPKPKISPSIPSVSASSAQADLLISTDSIAAIISESEPVNAIPNNVPSTSNLSTVPSNSGVQSTSIQDAKQKAKTRARKRKKRAA